MRKLAIILNAILLSYFITYAGTIDSDGGVWSIEGTLDYFISFVNGDFYRNDPFFFFFDLFVLVTPLISLQFLLTHKVATVSEEDSETISSRF